MDQIKNLCIDIANAIRDKKKTDQLIAPKDFSKEIESIEAKASFTGHADVEGLRAIGWTDEDIAYYQENGVNWNAEDDEYHKVSDDNKALYGVLTASNISTYKDRIVYLPKIDTSNETNMYGKFSSCRVLVTIPLLDTSNVTDMREMFSGCASLVTIPLLDISNVKYMGSMFSSCYSLVTIPLLDTSNVVDMSSMFSSCRSLVTIPLLDTSNVKNMGSMFSGCRSLVTIPLLDTSNVTDMNNMFNSCEVLVAIPLLDISNVKYMNNMMYNCASLVTIPLLDTANVINMSSMLSNCQHLTYIPLLNSSKNANIFEFNQCWNLIHVYIDGIQKNCFLTSCSLLSKESLLYLINNEAAETAIKIAVHGNTYKQLSKDPDVVAALANHPNISIAQ